MDVRSAFLVLLQDFTATMKKLSAEQFDQLLAGHARLAFLPPGASIVFAGPDAKVIRAELASLESRRAAVDYLAGLKLKKAELVSLANQFTVGVRSKDTVPVIREMIADATVGVHEDTAAIHSTKWRT